MKSDVFKVTLKNPKQAMQGSNQGYILITPEPGFKRIPDGGKRSRSLSCLKLNYFHVSTKIEWTDIPLFVKSGSPRRYPHGKLGD